MARATATPAVHRWWCAIYAGRTVALFATEQDAAEYVHHLGRVPRLRDVKPHLTLVWTDPQDGGYPATLIPSRQAVAHLRRAYKLMPVECDLEAGHAYAPITQEVK